ncbi:MAG TPA: S8 family serine peptidase [Pelobium sp.]|nr:S8 family serine peptidase [Pelobium sp.]
MLKKTVFFLLMVCLSHAVFAQIPQTLVTKKQSEKLAQLSVDFSAKKERNREKAFLMAKENNWPIFKSQKDGSIISLQGVDDLGFPLYLKTFDNVIAASTTKTTSLYNGGSLGANVNGASNSLIGKVGIWDGGGIFLSHQEFAPGRIEQKDKPTNINLHSTHVAGTMVAKGVYPIARGMAWGLQKLYAWDFDNDASEMTKAATAGMLISNHSYGYIAGWDYNSDANPPRWEYYGVPGSTEDYKFGFYDDSARDWDLICYNAPYYLPVVSAGNSRNLNGPAVGEEYYGYESSSSSKFVSKGKRPAGISSNDGYDIIATTANAKNILTIGAVSGLPYGSNSPADIKIASFSSWGPTDDGRIKPDLVADGVAVTSTSSDNTKTYITLSGTSMASPNVSGSLVLLQEYYAQLNDGAFMRSATLKGLAINTADEAGTSIGPDYIFGWGLLNMENAGKLIKLNGTKSIINERTLAQGEIYNLNIISSGYGPLKATICWTDPEGTVKPDGTINDRTPKLVNDLDLRLIRGATTYLPFKLNPLSPATAATTADNNVDNVEQVYIPNATPGQTYTLKISHKGALTKGPQKYSIIVSGVGGQVYCSSAPTASNDAIIEKVQIGSINNTIPLSCRTYSDFTNLSTDLEEGKTYPFIIDVGTCGANSDKIAGVFIDWNGDGDFSDNDEMVAKSAVFNANGTFTGNINVPIGVIAGNYSLLRIVLNQTDNAANVLSCGNYEKGETQDYKIHFIKSTTDAGIIAINNQLENLCAATTLNFSVKIKNFGSATLSNIPVTLTLSSNNAVLKTVTEVFAGPLAPNAETDFTFATGFDLQLNSTYTIDAKTAYSSDVIIQNNAFSKSFSTTSPQNPIDLNVIACDNAPGYYQLNGSGDGTLFWYSATNAGLPFQIGDNTFTDQKPIANTFYVGLNDFKSYFGAKNKKIYAGGNYSGNFGPKPIITVKAPMVLDSALLYISRSGQLTFTVETSDGLILDSKTINVERTKTTPDVESSADLIDDDPNDPGKMFKIGLEFPAEGTYYIGIEFNGATIFRSNKGVNNLPISLGNDIINLSGAYSDTNGIITSSYYYFYNMLFKSLGCSNFNRIAVTLGRPTIAQNGTTLTASIANAYQWYLNNVKITGATNQTYNPTVSGLYQVDAISQSGCISKSANFNYVFSSVKPADPQEINFKVFPIPASETLNYSFELLKRENLVISITNTIGQKVYERKQNEFLGKLADGINIKDYPTGNYIFTVKTGNKVYSQKISIVH